jgi:hypothetical protein
MENGVGPCQYPELSAKRRTGASLRLTTFYPASDTPITVSKFLRILASIIYLLANAKLNIPLLLRIGERKSSPFSNHLFTDSLQIDSFGIGKMLIIITPNER